MKINRVFLCVMDSFGCGEAPDSADFGDEGANTLRSCAKSTYFCADNLISLGLGNVEGVDCLECAKAPRGAYCRLTERSRGKDTTVGHWEIAGYSSRSPLPTYPDGFPSELIDKIEKAFGTKVLCNKPYSGTVVINDYGDEHVATGFPIVYTSADSVFQIACHEDIVPLERLYELCEIARKILVGEHGVGRVIARPFVGTSGYYTRTANRRDYSLIPPADTLLDYLKNDNFDVIAVGKINDIFAGKGITEAIASHANAEGIQIMQEMLPRDFHGLCFINLVDFDMLYGHRRDVDGYARAVSEFDEFLPSFIEGMKEDDLLIITADHGCDPAFIKTTDHTREYVPMIVFGDAIKPCDLRTRDTFADIAASICELLGCDYKGEGESFASKTLK